MAFVYTVIVVYTFSKNVYSDPLLTNIESLQHPAWEQPFPTIHICPLNRISKDAITKKVDKWILPQNITKNEILKKLKAITIGAFRLYDFPDSEIIAQIMAMNNVSLIHLINEVSLPCDKMMSLCRWKSMDFDCANLFTKMLTSDGACCAFNYIPPQLSTNLTADTKLNTMSGSGFTTGLKVALFINDSDGFSSLSSSRGYFIWAGAPGSYTSGRTLGRVLRRNSANFYSFTSTRIERTAAVKGLPDKYKGCTGPDRKLAAFHVYSMSNCKAECILNTTLKLCQCVPIIYPKYSDDQRYCEISDMKCLGSDAIRNAMKYIASGINGSEYDENILEIENARPCNCHPQCRTHYFFDVAASSSPIHIDLHGWTHRNMSYFCDVYIFSQGNMLTKIITNVKFDTTELMGFLGSIASFTMGWSIICVIEIIHFILQITINYCTNKIEEARGIKTLHHNKSLRKFQRKSRF